MTYSIDFPPRFVSRTCGDPLDPCHMLPKVNRTPPPRPTTREARIKYGSRAWRIWDYLSRNGRSSAAILGEALEIEHRRVGEAMVYAVGSGAVEKAKVGAEMEYWIGQTKVRVL
jgi:hypothetical protein